MGNDAVLALIGDLYGQLTAANMRITELEQVLQQQMQATQEPEVQPLTDNGHKDAEAVVPASVPTEN